MELKDTIEMMTSSDFKERFKAEYFQLVIRMDKLSEMLDKYKAGELNFKPKCDYNTLLDQYVSMSAYKNYLKKRAEIEGIDLK